MPKEKMSRRLMDLEKTRNEILHSHAHFIAIYAGTGAGKTTLIEGFHDGKNDFLGLSESHKVALITSRKQKVKETTAKNQDKFLGDLRDLGAVIHWDNNNLNVTCTNAHIHQYAIQHFNIQNELTYFWREFDFIIIDEGHSICTDSSFTDCAPTIKHLIEIILDDCRKNKEISTKVILMTATPEPVEWLCKELNAEIIDLRKDTSYLKPSQIDVLHYKLAEQRIGMAINQGKTIVYYLAHLNNLLRLIDYGLAHGLDKSQIAVSISDKNKLNDLKQGYSEIRKNTEILEKSLSDTETIPSQFKLIITNGKCKEAININTVVDLLIVESHYIVDMIQIFGRCRKGLKEVCLVSDAHQFILGDRFENEAEFIESIIDRANVGFSKRYHPDKNIIYPFISQSESALQYVNSLVTWSPYMCFNVFLRQFELNHCYIYFKEHYEKSVRTLENAISHETDWSEVDEFFADICIKYPTKVEPSSFVDNWFGENKLSLGSSKLNRKQLESLANYLKEQLPKIPNAPKKDYKNIKTILKFFECDYKVIGHKGGKAHESYIVFPMVGNTYNFLNCFHYRKTFLGESIVGFGNSPSPNYPNMMG